MRRRLLDRLENPLVAAAAADVAAHPLPDLVVRLRVSFAEKGDAGTDLPRGAVAALESVVSDEGGLQRMETAVRTDSLDRGDLVAAVHDGEREAGVDAAAVDENGAG